MTETATTQRSIAIREIDTPSEMRAVEELQKEVWGIPDLDVVPFSHLIAAQAAGGVLLGAFDETELVAFAYGFVGYEQGKIAHHSHMLAVKPQYRNSNLGYALKLAQREHILKQGIGLMSWTFDPLQSLNAYFNFAKLGVVADRYLVNFYGEDAASFLHRNGTDRLWVSWYVTSSHVKERLAGVKPEPPPIAALSLVEITSHQSPWRNDAATVMSGDPILIEIPADINSIQQRDVELAVEWRESTRWAFTTALSAGYAVVDFQRLERNQQRFGAYVLSRENKL